ncbi:MAG: AAA family ATPase, partial [Microbacteriaceae bacterium]|nr:AAA family ATPase [Burkholderiaceae bacterium]
MYASFFGLKQLPFSIAPDPRYLYMSERHREALAHLLFGVQGGGGFVLLSGEIGAGKTTVCRCFLEQVPPDCQVAYIFNPQLTVPELLQTVCDEFGIAVPVGAVPASLKTYIDALNAHLLAAHAQGRHCLLIIDEAQHLSAEVLEQLRLLTNLETRERKLLQIILIGQPELRTLLAGAGLEQLAQRVIARYHLGALTAPDTAAYVAHRMAVAGLAGPLPFDAAALRRIHRLSGGVPRRINLLCDRALLGAFAEGRARIGARIVGRAASEVFDAGAAAPRQRPVLLLATGLGGGLALAVLAAAGWLAEPPGPRWPAGAVATAAATPAAAAAPLAAGARAARGAAVVSAPTVVAAAPLAAAVAGAGPP